MTVASEADRPSAVLRREHRVIERVLDVLERVLDRMPDATPDATPDAGDGLDTEALERCVTFFRLFADACHHAKEEDLLFPVLEERGVPRDGGPIGVMLYEHRVARGLVRQMGEGLERLENDAEAAEEIERAGHEYIDLLRQHIAKEDNVLFQIGDQVMSEDDQRRLGASFCDVGCRAFEGKRREELEALADELEARWGEPR